MQVELTHAAEIALRTLGDDDRRRVRAWCDHLRNWERDETIRARARRLNVPGHTGVYVLTTTIMGTRKIAMPIFCVRLSSKRLAGG